MRDGKQGQCCLLSTCESNGKWGIVIRYQCMRAREDKRDECGRGTTVVCNVTDSGRVE
jgi:hypothetical protein